MRALIAAIAAALALPVVASAQNFLGAWQITQSTSPLTNATSISAQVESTELLSNQIGQPEHAALVMSCTEGQLAFFVSWPRVVSHDTESALLQMPETLALNKVDDGKIKTDFWVISDSGTGAGSFDNIGAPRLIASISAGKRYVVRLGGQDASFDIHGADIVAAWLSAACKTKIAGVTPAEPPSAAFKTTTAALTAGAEPPRFGVYGMAITETVAKAMGLPATSGILIVTVVPGSVAARSGFEARGTSSPNLPELRRLTSRRSKPLPKPCRTVRQSTSLSYDGARR